MFDTLISDLNAVMTRDPAVRSRLEVFLCYPGFKAIRAHRRAHRAYQKKRFLLARFLSARARHRTGIEIHPGAEIGEGLFIDHGSGVVIGETAVIGKNVTLYQGATLGGTGKDTGKRHPTLGDGVTVGAGAKVLGPITIGNHVKIGAGAIVLRDVPDDCTVVGNPGRIVRRPTPAPDVDLNHSDLPDPMLDKMQALYHRLTALEKVLCEYAVKLGCDECAVEHCSKRDDLRAIEKLSEATEI